jgi:hypothetical protein
MRASVISLVTQITHHRPPASVLRRQLLHQWMYCTDPTRAIENERDLRTLLLGSCYYPFILFLEQLPFFAAPRSLAIYRAPRPHLAKFQVHRHFYLPSIN